MLNIAGFTKFSTVDWPGKLVCTLFLQGCPYACGYCHNWSILDPKVMGDVKWEQVEQLLHSRKGLLDGVVFSGGEPTMQPLIVKAVQKVKDMGYLVGLHTMGFNPLVLQDMLSNLDWVGLDIKADWQHYDDVTKLKGSAKLAIESLEILLKSKREYNISIQTRTTPDLIVWEQNTKLGIDTNQEILAQLTLLDEKWGSIDPKQSLAKNHVFQKTDLTNTAPDYCQKVHKIKH